MKQSWRYFLILLMMVIIFIFIIINGKFFIDHLVDPLTRIFWLISRVLSVFNQEDIWLILVMTVTVVGLLIIPREMENSPQKRNTNINQNCNMVTQWESRFRQAEFNVKERMELQQDLQTLINSINKSAGDNETVVVFPSLSKKPIEIVSRKIQYLFSQFHKVTEKFYDKELEIGINQILHFMETRMEKQNEQSRRHD